MACADAVRLLRASSELRRAARSFVRAATEAQHGISSGDSLADLASLERAPILFKAQSRPISTDLARSRPTPTLRPTQGELRLRLQPSATVRCLTPTRLSRWPGACFLAH